MLSILAPAEDASVVDEAVQAALRAGKRRPAVVAAIDALKDAARLPFAEGLARERVVFQQLRVSTEASALRHQFFAERDAVRLPADVKTAPRPVETIAIIGAGTMGTGIAIAALDVGLTVVLLQQDEAALARGRQRVADHYQGRLAAGKLKGSAAAGHEALLHTTPDWAQLARADLVIEAVFEDLTVKQGVFRQIDARARPGAVLATNTSYLDVDAIANATAGPQGVLSLHFFSPANVAKLLEVVLGAQTAPEVLATGMAVGKLLRKMPVLCGNAFGFIGNRIGPASATQKLLAQAGITLAQMDVIELNEAFAAQVVAVLRALGLKDNDERVNAWGDAIALGHPLRASGARLVTTATNRLNATGGRYALCTMCIGVGQASRC